MSRVEHSRCMIREMPERLGCIYLKTSLLKRQQTIHMDIILVIVYIVAVVVGLLLVAALIMRKEHFVKRSIVINEPVAKVFGFLRLLKNQDKFNKWAKTDPHRKVTTTGIDGTVGYVYAWTGNKDAGEGAKEIIAIVENEKVETEIRFTKPMKVSARVIMEMEALSDSQTKVYLTNAGTLPFPFNLMIPVAEKNFAKDLDESLHSLKRILENDV